MTQTPAIEAQGVAFAYGERRALAGIDLTIARGEKHALLGPNGSGKSTLFKLLSTLVPLQAGSVRMLGLDLAREAAAIRRRIGVVFQSPAVDRKLSVCENLRYGGKLLGMSGAALEGRIDELLAAAGLGDRGKDRVEQLSGGLRRRVEICKCLLAKPELLLLDEASTGLDPAARNDMWSLLRAQHGLTVLFTTHLMDEAQGADRITLLDAGAVVASGTPKELMRGMGGQVLEVECRDPQALARDVEAALGQKAQVFDAAIRMAGETVHELVPAVVQRFGDRVERLSLSHPSLEDVFVRRTGKRFVATAPEPETQGKRRRR